MPKVDRRIQKSQEAIQKAVIELMSEMNFDDITIQNISDRANVSRGTIYLHYLDKFDLLDKLIASHINHLKELCETAADLDYSGALLIWSEYFARHYLFFSTMLASKGAPYFRNQFRDLLVTLLKNEINVTKGVNSSLREEVILQFLASAMTGVVEWWFVNGMPFSPQVMAEQLGILLERNLG
jgi:AcrR family transcriptional regulator